MGSSCLYLVPCMYMMSSLRFIRHVHWVLWQLHFNIQKRWCCFVFYDVGYWHWLRCGVLCGFIVLGDWLFGG